MVEGGGAVRPSLDRGRATRCIQLISPTSAVLIQNVQMVYERSNGIFQPNSSYRGEATILPWFQKIEGPNRRAGIT